MVPLEPQTAAPLNVPVTVHSLKLLVGVNVQVIVVADHPGQAPQVVEDRPRLDGLVLPVLFIVRDNLLQKGQVFR